MFGRSSAPLEEALQVRRGCEFETCEKEVGSSAAVCGKDKSMEKQVSTLQSELNQDQVCEVLCRGNHTTLSAIWN